MSIRNNNHLAMLEWLQSEQKDISQDILKEKLNLSTSQYYQVKSSLKYQLVNQLLFNIPLNTFTLEIEKEYYHSMQNLLAFSLAPSKLNYQIKKFLVYEIYSKASYYEFTEIKFVLLKLIANSSIPSNSIKPPINYLNIAELYRVEVKLEQIRVEIFFILGNNKNKPNAEIQVLLSSQREFIFSSLQRFDSFRVIWLGYTILLIDNLLNFRYNELIKHATIATVKLRSKPFKLANIIADISTFKMMGLINIGNYQQAIKIGLENKTHTELFAHTWYSICYYTLIACIHSKQYNLSMDISIYISKHHNFKQLTQNRKENHLVQCAYLQFLYKRNIIKNSALNNNSIPTFRLYKFLNDVPIYSKDKSGLNVAILIVHVLFLLHKKNYNKIYDRIDSLNQYCYRYLRKDETFRANCFIKMLLQLPKADFKRDLTEKYARSYRQKLSTIPINVVEQGIENEVIPYEHLWEMVLEMLD